MKRLIAVTLLLLGGCAADTPSPAEDLWRLSHAIKVGDTQEQVQTLLGPPDDVSSSTYAGERWESWEYCPPAYDCVVEITFVNGEVHNIYRY